MIIFGKEEAKKCLKEYKKAERVCSECKYQYMCGLFGAEVQMAIKEKFFVINTSTKRSIQVESNTSSHAFQIDVEVYSAVNMADNEYHLIITNPRSGEVKEIITRTNLAQFIFDCGYSITDIINKDVADLAWDFLLSPLTK